LHATVLRDELLGRVGGGGGGSGDAADGGLEGGGLSMAGLDVTSGWDDVSLASAPERASAGNAKYPVPPRLAAAAAASAAARAQQARLAALAGSPSRGGGGGHLLLAREEDDFLGPGGGYKENYGVGGGLEGGAEAHLAGVLNAPPLDGTSHWGVSASAIAHKASATAAGVAGGGLSGGGLASRVLRFGSANSPSPLYGRSSSLSAGGAGAAAPGSSALREAFVASPLGGSLVALGARSEALLSSPPLLPKRRIAHVPYKVLDAPNLADDFYLNLLDWGAQNVVAVGLEKEVYLWNGFTANVTKLTSLANKVNSVRWSGRGGHLMVGAEDGMVKLWDAVASRELRKLKTHSLRVGVGAWAGPLLATGSKDKQIHLHDVRSKAKFEHKLTSHTHEVRVVLLCLWPCVCTRFSLSLSLSHTHTRTRAHTHV